MANAITIFTSPDPLVIEINGTPATAPYSFSCDPGTNHTLSAPSPQLNGFTRYTFLNWSDGGNRSHVIGCTASENYTAFFLREYALSIGTDPSGLTVEVDGIPHTAPFVVWCPSGSTPSVRAPSPQGFNATQFFFASWSDGGPQNHTLLCDSPRSLAARFQIVITMTIFSNVQGGFIVVVDGELQTLPHQFSCDPGTVHVISVPSPQSVSGAQWRFARWFDLGPDPSPNPRAIPCDGPTNYTVVFERAQTPGPTPGLSGPLIALVILAIAGAIVLPAVGLWLGYRNRMRESAPPPAPIGATLFPSSVRRCARCGSPGAPDWTYCMVCGEPLR